MATAKPKGLILTLEGAPNTPHVVEGVPGLYRPDVPTPIGETVGFEQAKKYDADESVPLKIVEIKDAELAKHLFDEAIADSKNIQRSLRRSKGKGGESAFLEDEINATKGA
jgi:hypothetical protein